MSNHYSDAIVVSVDFRHNDGVANDIMVVGKRMFNGEMKVINAFEGADARELWDKLTTKKGGSK